MSGRRTKEQTRTAWAQVLTTTLPDEVSAQDIADTVGLKPNSAREWLLRRVNHGQLKSARRGAVRVWNLDEVRAAIATALDLDLLGSGNRTIRASTTPDREGAEPCYCAGCVGEGPCDAEPPGAIGNASGTTA